MTKISSKEILQIDLETMAVVLSRCVNEKRLKGLKRSTDTL